MQNVDIVSSSLKQNEPEVIYQAILLNVMLDHSLDSNEYLQKPHNGQD